MRGITIAAVLAATAFASGAAAMAHAAKPGDGGPAPKNNQDGSPTMLYTGSGWVMCQAGSVQPRSDGTYICRTTGGDIRTGRPDDSGLAPIDPRIRKTGKANGS